MCLASPGRIVPVSDSCGRCSLAAWLAGRHLAAGVAAVSAPATACCTLTASTHCFSVVSSPQTRPRPDC